MVFLLGLIIGVLIGASMFKRRRLPFTLRASPLFWSSAAAIAILLPIPEVAEGHTSDEDAYVATSWEDGKVVVAPTRDVAVTLHLEVRHGDQMWTVEGARTVVTSDSQTALSVTWPDLSSRGDLLVAPAVVTGFVRVEVDSKSVGVVPVEMQLWFPSDPTTTLDLDRIADLVGIEVEEGDALASIAPETVLEVTSGGAE